MSNEQQVCQNFKFISINSNLSELDSKIVNFKAIHWDCWNVTSCFVDVSDLDNYYGLYMNVIKNTYSGFSIDVIIVSSNIVNFNNCYCSYEYDTTNKRIIITPPINAYFSGALFYLGHM